MKVSITAGIAATALVIAAGAGAVQARYELPIAHGGLHNQNTAPDSDESKKRAWKHKMCPETDIRQTLETPQEPMRIVEMHDRNVRKQTGVNALVDELTWPQFHALTLRDGQHPPSIEHTIRLAERRGGKCVLAEVKDITGDPTWTAADYHYLQHYAAQHGMVHKLWLYIPRQSGLLIAKEAAPRLHTVWKMKQDMPDNATLRNLSIDGVVPRWGGMYRNNVIKCHRLGIKIYGGVSNNKSRWAQVIRIGADGALSNRAAMQTYFANH